MVGDARGSDSTCAAKQLGIVYLILQVHQLLSLVFKLPLHLLCLSLSLLQFFLQCLPL